MSVGRKTYIEKTVVKQEGTGAQCKPKMHTVHQNHNNVIICQILPVLALTGPSSENVQLH